jgi:hypothetical protein
LCNDLPPTRPPSNRKRRYKQITACDNRLTCTIVFNNPRHTAHTIQALRTSIPAIPRHQPRLREQPHRHQCAPPHHDFSSRPSIHEDKRGHGHRDVDDVLDTRCNEREVPAEAGHLEDVDDVVHHGVGAGVLRPDVREDGAVNADDVLPLNELGPGL